MIVGVDEEVGPVMRIAAANCAVDVENGVFVRTRGAVGEKKRSANACCVSARSNGVGVGVKRGARTISSCVSSTPKENNKGIPNAIRHTPITMTGIIRLWFFLFSIV